MILLAWQIWRCKVNLVRPVAIIHTNSGRVSTKNLNLPFSDQWDYDYDLQEPRRERGAARSLLTGGLGKAGRIIIIAILIITVITNIITIIIILMGESRQVKKRQVGSRLQHLLSINGGEDQVSIIFNQPTDISLLQVENGSKFDSEDSPSPAPPRPSSVLLSPVRKDVKPRPMSDIWPISPNTRREQKPPSPKLSPKVRKKEPVAEEKEDWKDTMKRMRDQIKAVQELPKVEVPKSLVKTVTSASSPDLTLYSSASKLSRVEASWEIRARYRNMRTEELYQSQLVKKSGYSWREKVPEIQNTKLKFTEPRNNVVTDMNFIGATYVQVRQPTF